MKIAIETHALSQEKITGVGTVILHYLNELQHIDLENEYYIYAMDGLRHVTLRNPRWRYVEFRYPLGSLRRRTRERWQELAKTDNEHRSTGMRVRILGLRLAKIVLEAVDELAYSCRLASSLRKLGVDIYIGTSTYYYPPFFFSRVKKAAIIYDLVWKLYPKTMEFGNRIRMTLFTLRNMRKLDLLISISSNTKKDAREILKLKNRIEAIPLAADGSLFYRAPASKVSAVKKKYCITRPYILSVCTLEPRKNLRSLIAAFRQLPRRRDYQLVLVGMTGWIESEFFSFLGGSDVRESVIITGYLPASELAPVYTGADLFVFPSFYEGFGLPILEAMQCGCPVITSHTSSMPEVAGDAAVMIDPDDVPGIARAMHAVLTDSALRKSLSRRGLERSRVFSWEQSARLLLRALQSLC